MLFCCATTSGHLLVFYQVKVTEDLAVLNEVSQDQENAWLGTTT